MKGNRLLVVVLDMGLASVTPGLFSLFCPPFIQIQAEMWNIGDGSEDRVGYDMVWCGVWW